VFGWCVGRRSLLGDCVRLIRNAIEGMTTECQLLAVKIHHHVRELKSSLCKNSFLIRSDYLRISM
jgi:hypothetical protein